MHSLAPRLLSGGLSLAAAILIVSGPFAASASADDGVFRPDDLVVSRSVYRGTASTVTIGELLPPTCPATAACGGATNTGVPLSTTACFRRLARPTTSGTTTASTPASA
jgi:hypothetical protein